MPVCTPSASPRSTAVQSLHGSPAERGVQPVPRLALATITHTFPAYAMCRKAGRHSSCATMAPHRISTGLFNRNKFAIVFTNRYDSAQASALGDRWSSALWRRCAQGVRQRSAMHALAAGTSPTLGTHMVGGLGARSREVGKNRVCLRDDEFPRAPRQRWGSKVIGRIVAAAAVLLRGRMFDSKRYRILPGQGDNGFCQIRWMTPAFGISVPQRVHCQRPTPRSRPPCRFQP